MQRSESRVGSEGQGQLNCSIRSDIATAQIQISESRVGSEGLAQLCGLTFTDLIQVQMQICECRVEGEGPGKLRDPASSDLLRVQIQSSVERVVIRFELSNDPNQFGRESGGTGTGHDQDQVSVREFEACLLS